ncbi:MAG: hypothetical protein AB7I30_18800 [Isosphaeraceae bacterium]
MRRIMMRMVVVPLFVLGSGAVLHPARADVEVFLRVGIAPAVQPGLYHYIFVLSLDNPTGTWVPGQGYGGIVFGDVPAAGAPSPIADFTLDPGVTPIGPWNGLGLASGAHNGPTLTPVVDGGLNPVIWTPAFVGDSLTWSGTSQFSNPLCDLTFSTLFTTGGATPAHFKTILCVPEPGPLTLAGVATPIALAAVWRSRRHRITSRENIM